MSWHQTHQRTQVLREVEDAVDRDPRSPLPWRPAYAVLFGDRAGLVAYLDYRWRLRLAEPPVDDVHREHPALGRARLGLAYLALQELDRAVA